jgi:beta-glucosidase
LKRVQYLHIRSTPRRLARRECGRFRRIFGGGVSTAAYQAEGGWNEDGKGESVWDHFTHTPSMIKGAATGDITCDTYHRYADDLRLMKHLNVQSYRFSISWPRVRPTGRGPINQKGLDYYNRLTDAVLAQGTRPVCTLFHWDLPQELSASAWRSRETVKLFGEYVEVVSRTLGDRIKTWAILNEPAVFARGAYGLPLAAPEKSSFEASLQSQHGANLATGEAFRALKAAHGDAMVGNALSMSPVEPLTDSAEDKAAAARFHAWLNLWFLEPSLRGRYPNAFVGDQPLAAMDFRTGDDGREPGFGHGFATPKRTADGSVCSSRHRRCVNSVDKVVPVLTYRLHSRCAQSSLPHRAAIREAQTHFFR